MPPKPGIHTQPDAFIHAMPAYIPDMGAAGMKWVSGYPSNQAKGLPYITGLMVLNDPDTGLPLAVMDCVWITAMRTGAATALAARYLARSDSRILGILGCGVQGESNLEALMVVQKELSTVVAYDVLPAKTDGFLDKMRAKFPRIDFIKAGRPVEAVADSDIIVTAGPILKHPTPTIERDWFKEGAFASPVDFDSYWKPEAMHTSDKFCTDDIPQLLYYKKNGYFQDIPALYADLGEIACGMKPGRENPRERIISANLGIALEDMATGIWIYHAALQAGIGLELQP
jgi:ornithine cyclodeaminase/alanine dehydrogenase